MRSRKFILLFFTLLSSWALAQSYFIQNKGQWEGDFEYRLELGPTTVFFSKEHLTFISSDESQWLALGEAIHEKSLSQGMMNHHAYRLEFLNSQTQLIEAKSGIGPKINYIHSADSTQWVSNLEMYQELWYREVYPNIDLHFYFSSEGYLKYDFIIKPMANPDQISWKYSGIDYELFDNQIKIASSVGDFYENEPIAYELESADDVKVSFKKTDNNELGFKLGRYDKDEVLVIDPLLIFSSLIGTSFVNFGFTATPAADGSLYGAGIIFRDVAKQYPTTLGAFQTSYQGGDMDIGISKFSADGTQLIYSTYVGGSNTELPLSMIENSQGELVVLAATGSSDFPMLPNSAISTMIPGDSVNIFNGLEGSPDGLDIAIFKLNASGSAISGSSFLGGSGQDGYNRRNNKNYGDNFRGEVNIDNQDNIYLVTTSSSPEIPVSLSAYRDTNEAEESALLASFSPTLDSLFWYSFYGGSNNTAGFSIDVFSGTLALTGVTTAIDLDGVSPLSLQDSLAGLRDSYISTFSADSGIFKQATYIGTAQDDYSFFIRNSLLDSWVIFGQSWGDLPLYGDSIFGQLGSVQFLQEYSGTLDSLMKSTVFGDGPTRTAIISPTALMVDSCQNVYVSGWGGQVNAVYAGGNTNNFPIDPNAIQPNTDGSDFYFMTLDASWQKMNYSTYFGGIGGGSSEHVDGGTSRFSKDGTIYQAVCSCGPFPTSPGAWAGNDTSNGRCNLGVIKVAIENNQVIADYRPINDSICVPGNIVMADSTYNADIYILHYPDGTIDTLGNLEETIFLDSVGPVNFLVIAIDTSCQLIDSTNFTVYGIIDSVHSDFELLVDSCNSNAVSFYSEAFNASSIQWFLNDSLVSSQDSVSTNLPIGNYKISLHAISSVCAIIDSTDKYFRIFDTRSDASIRSTYSSCDLSKTVNTLAVGEDFQMFQWKWSDGGISQGRRSTYSFDEANEYKVVLTAEDTICGRTQEIEYTFDFSASNLKLEEVNIFTPNGDGQNDVFELKLEERDLDVSISFEIFNRWGEKVFESSEVIPSWDGTLESNNLDEGVYYYTAAVIDACGNSKEIKGFVHLNR